MLVNGYEIPNEHIDDNGRFNMLGLVGEGGPTELGQHLTEIVNFSLRTSPIGPPNIVSYPQSILLRQFLPHFIKCEIPVERTGNESDFSEPLAWVGENARGVWALWIGGFFFSDPIDAVAFKIRWC